MFCANCGTELAGQFCSGCGSRAAGVAANVPAVSVRNVYRGKNKQIAGGLVMMLSLFVGFIGCGAAIGSSDPGVPTSVSIALILFAVGLGIYSVGRYQHWYHAE